MNINSSFPSTYIAASDLRGASVNVTIREVKIEQVGRDRENKPVLYFEGKQKGMVLNKTNARKIANLVGSMDTDDWVGCQVAIFPTETEFAGETVECIRVKAAVMARQAKAAQPDSFDSAPVEKMPMPAAPRQQPAAQVIDEDSIPF